MYIFNTENMGRPYTAISLVSGFASMSNSFGSNDAMFAECKNQALNSLCGEAARYGADAVVNVRFQVVLTNRLLVFVYGTAVKLN